MTPQKIFLPLYLTPIPAGFPSPADDYIADSIDLNDFLIKNRPSTYFFKMEGNAMLEDRICDGDILIVDASLHARNRSIVVVSLEGEILIRRIFYEKENIILRASQPNYSEITITPETEYSIFGVVTGVIRKLR